MIMNKQLLYTLFALIAVPFFSCTNDIASEAGIGTVSFTVENAATDVVVETRAMSDIEEDDLMLTLKRGEEKLISGQTYGNIKEKHIPYSAGDGYVLTVENCTETEAENTNISNGIYWGQERVYGKKEFSVIANQDNPVEVVCKLANSGVSVDFSGYVKNKWPDCQVEIYAADAEERKFTFNQHVYNKRAFFNVDEGKQRAIQYIVTLQENAGGHTEDENGEPFTFNMEPGHYYNVTVKMKDEESADPQVTIQLMVDGDLEDEIPLDDVIVNPYK